MLTCRKPARKHIAFQTQRIRQVAVVGPRTESVGRVHVHRLRFGRTRGAGRRIAGRGRCPSFPRSRRMCRSSKHVANESVAPCAGSSGTRRPQVDDACGILAPMLERQQRVVDLLIHRGLADEADDAHTLSDRLHGRSRATHDGSHDLVERSHKLLFEAQQHGGRSSTSAHHSRVSANGRSMMRGDEYDQGSASRAEHQAERFGRCRSKPVESHHTSDNAFARWRRTHTTTTKTIVNPIADCSPRTNLEAQQARDRTGERDAQQQRGRPDHQGQHTSRRNPRIKPNTAETTMTVPMTTSATGRSPTGITG